MDNGESSYRCFLAGDDEGLHEIICTYRAGLIFYLNSFVQNIHTAEDLTEDTFAELAIKCPKFSGKKLFQNMAVYNRASYCSGSHPKDIQNAVCTAGIAGFSGGQCRP